ncbi:MAG: hypothetical protein OEY14_06675 [Myxococcales bacterium]|nr:hypothetical protein [Myxococcales bacterium]
MSTSIQILQMAGGPPPAGGGQYGGGQGFGGQGFGGPPPGGDGGFVSGPSGGGGEPPQGFKIASIILLSIGAAGFVLGLIPCLGWVNWFSIPMNVGAIIAGILGLVSGPKDISGRAMHQGLHLAALIVGVVGAIGGFLRCILGGGIL